MVIRNGETSTVQLTSKGSRAFVGLVSLFTVLVGLLLAIGTIAESSKRAEMGTDSFRWLVSPKDSALIEKVEIAFAEELKAGDLHEPSPTLSAVSKRIFKVGQYRDFMLVITFSVEVAFPYRDFYTAYNFDRNSGKISKISAKDTFWRWEFYRLARFDESPTPDVSFTYYDCMDCEAAKILASFQFDPEALQWRVRLWGSHEGILIDSSQFGDDSWTYDCLFKVLDLNGDGFEDVAVRCKGTGPVPGAASDSTEFYTTARGNSQEREITDKAQLARISKVLCNGVKNSKLCKGK
jgi:hypothetical protein